MMNGKTMKKHLLKGICLGLILTLCFLCASALAVSEKDGSKIESVTLSWITPESTVTNTGDPYDDSAVDPYNNDLFIATSSDNELFLKYQVDISFSGQHDYAPGTVTITLPAQVWHQRVYDADNVGHATGDLFGSLELSVPESPDTSAAFNWQLETIDGKEMYVLTNTRTIGATSKASLQFTVCGVMPHEIVDMSRTDPISVTCEVITNKGNVIGLGSENQLTAQLDTIEQLPENGTVKLSQYYSSIPADMPVSYFSRIGGAAAAGDYAAVQWEVYVNHEGNQPFTLTLEDDFAVPYYLDDDDQPVAIDAKPVFLGSDPGAYNNYPPELFSFSADGTSFTYKTVVDPAYDDHRNDPLTGKDHLITIWTAYPKSAMPADENKDATIYYFVNNAKCTLTEADAEVDDPVAGKDERMVTTSSASATETYTAVDKFFAGGVTIVNKYTKDGESFEETYPYTLNLLQKGENAELEFVVEAVNFDWDATTPITYNDKEGRPYTAEELKAVERDSTSYGQLGWRFTATDDKLYFNGSSQPMDEDDYYISSLQLDEITKVAFGPCIPAINLAWGLSDDGAYRLRWVYRGEECYYEDATLPMPDVAFEIQLNGAWVQAATAQWDESGSVSFTDLSNGVTGDASTGTLHFPEGTTGYRFTVTSTLVRGEYLESSKLAGLSLKVRPTVTVMPSDDIMAVVNSAVAAMTNPSVIVKNTADMYNSGWVDRSGNGSEPVFINDDFAIAKMTAAGYGAYLIKTAKYDRATDDNVKARTATVHYTGTLHETSNLKTTDDYLTAQAGGAIPAETKGIWYDLLPEGMVPDLTTVRAGGKDQITSVYTVPDHRGSGRTLLVAEVDLTPSLRTTDDESKDIEDVHTISFDGIIGYDEIEAFGELQKNYIAFESRTEDLPNGILGTTPNLQGAPDRPDRTVNSHTPNEADMPADIRALMTGLNPASDPDEARFVYAYAPVTTTVNFAAISGLAKMVSTVLDGVWTQGLDGQTQATVYEGHDYTYRLKVSSDTETITKNIFLFDTIENYHVPDDGTKTKDHEHIQDRVGWDGDWSATGQWRGTLNAIDLSEFIAAGAAPVLYYSTEDDLQFADSPAGATQAEKDLIFNSEEYDVTTGHWTKADLGADGVWTVPAGTNVTAFAADLSHDAEGNDFLLGAGKSATVYLNMTAPDDNGDENVKHAKGAYARDDADGPIDWVAATDPVNNMYAYNNARMRCVQYDAKSSSGSTSTQTMIRNDYTRVGIIPQALRVVKDWQDDDDHDGMRPDELLVTLQRKKAGSDTVETVKDGSGAPLTVTLNETNSWTGVFLQTDIVDENGTPWQYQFVESLPDGSPVENGYTLQWNRTGSSEYTLTNTRENETVTIAGTKTWLNDANALNKRPDEITLTLYQDGTEIDRQTVKADKHGQWSYTFGEYEKYKKFDPSTMAEPEEHVYTVKEEPVTPYFANTDDYTRITNEYDPYGSLAIAKTVANAELSDAIADKAFTFRVELYAERTEEQQRAGEPRTPLTDNYTYKIQQYENGSWTDTGTTGTVSHNGTVSVKHGQRALIEKLPAGASYNIKENEEAGYTLTSYDGDHGTIESRVTTEAVFDNTYKAKGTIILRAGKVLTGEALKNRQFGFELVDESGEVVLTAYNGVPKNTQDTDGTITGTADVVFRQLKFTQKDIGKTYTYTLREAIPETRVKEMTYDTEGVEIAISISDNGDGTLSVTAEEGGNAYKSHTFKNEYTAQCKVELDLKKVLEGRALQDQEFTFGLYACGENGEDAEDTPLTTVTCDADGNIVFKDDANTDGPLTFNVKDLTLAYELEEDGAEPEAHYFLVKEIPGTDPDIVYTAEQKVFTVKVYDKRDGTLGYTIDSQKIIPGTKTDCDACDATGKIYSSKTTATFTLLKSKSPNISLSDIEGVEHLGSSFTVSHIGDGYFYEPVDEDCIEISVQMYKDILCPDCRGMGVTGDMSKLDQLTVNADGSLANGTECGIELCATCGGSGIDLSVKYEGYEDPEGAWDSYFFPRYLEGDITPYLIGYYAGGNAYIIQFAGYRWHGLEDGWDEVYEIEEDDCEKCHGLGYIGSDPSTSGDTDLPVLTNKLAPGKLHITKEVEVGGQTPDPDTEFRFSIQLSDSPYIPFSTGYVKSTGDTGTIIINSDGSFTVDLKAGETITFEDIPAGTSYTISEVVPDGWTLLESESASGKISTTDPSAAVFVNSYGSDVAALQIRKRISNYTKVSKEQVFTFEITLLDRHYRPLSGTYAGSDTLGNTYDITPDADGKAVITIKAGSIATVKGLPVGTIYSIRETGELPGWTLTNEQNVSGKILPASKQASDPAATSTANAVFTNSYSATGVVNLSVRKLLEGRELTEGEFTFGLYTWDTTTQTAGTEPLQTKVNQAADPDNIAFVVFDPITLKKETTQWYAVREILPASGEEDPAVNYSDEIIVIEVPVRDLDGKGTLSVGKYNSSNEWVPGPVYTLNGEAGDLITNTVKPGQLRLTKAVEGTLTDTAKAAVFNMLVTFTDSLGEPWTGTDGKILDDEGNTYTAKNGVFTIPVAAGEEVTLVDIPNGTDYKVEEDTTVSVYGWTYDTEVYTGTVESLLTGEDPETVTVTNTYAPTGELKVPVLGKELTSGEPENGQFSFDLLDESGEVLQTVSNDGNGNITFEDLKYTLADAGKTYTYQIVENEYPTSDITIDTVIRSFTVTIAEDPSVENGLKVTCGAVSAEKSVPEAMTFLNDVKTAIDIPVSKVWTGDTGHEDQRGEVTLTLYGITESGAKVSISVASSTETDALTNPWTITKDNARNNDTLSGVWYGVSLTVPSSGEKFVGYAVEETGCPEAYVSFVSGNEKDGYTASNRLVSATLPLTAAKTVDGEAPDADDMFCFVLQDESGSPLQTVYNMKGDVYFEDLLFTKADLGKTYVYTVIEGDPLAAGYTVDKATYTLTVTVDDDGSGAPKPQLTITDKNGDPVDTITFENKYTPEGEIQLEGTKTLVGRSLEDDDIFTFTVTENGETVTTGESDGNGVITFETIEYGKDDIGTHTYTITEDDTTIGGITKDDSELTVVVEVTDAGDGTLTAEIVDGESDDIEFANSYEAKGKLTFAGDKALVGRAMTADDKFTFTVKEGDKTVATGANNGTGTITFNKEIEYVLNGTKSDVGTYTYTVTEDDTSIGGVTRDPAVFTINVTVSDKGDGTLKVEKVITKDGKTVSAIAFTNSYEATGTLTFAGDKALVGRAMTADDKFTFTVKEGDKTVATGANNGTGTITFNKEIEYVLNGTKSDVGTYTYTVTEDDTSIGGVTRDPAVFTINVTVSDKGDGTLKVEKVFIKEGEAQKRIGFINSYEATGTLALTGTKALTGRSLTADDVFTFTVVETGRTGVAATGASDETGAITFSKIEYTLDDLGTHTYTIAEDDTNLGGVTKDDAELTVVVEVTDNGDGTLKVEKTITKDGKTVSAIAFENTYTATGSLTLEGTKALIGRDLEDDDIFTFIIKEGDKTVSTGISDSTGSITFLPISYTLADVGPHTYTITEDDTSIGGVTKDKKSLTINVTVTDNGDGTLSATPDSKNPAISFENIYGPTGSITFSGTKTIDGRAITADDKFTFSVMKDGEKVASGANNGTGTITFDEISYTLIDAGKTYTYTITEDDTAIPGITKDPTTKTVKVKITDNLDGTLTAKIVDSESDNIEFTNTYEAVGDITFEGTKTLTGRDLTADDVFTFTVTENGSEVAYGANDETGEITFSTIEYDLDDLGEHTYIITEDDTTLGGITKDDAELTVVVEVTDNGDGTLKAEIVAGESDDITFTNIYEAVGDITFEGTKTLTGRDLTADDVFTFTVVEDGRTGVTATGTSDETGAITFDKIEYTLDDLGTHTYTIAEDDTSILGVTKDASELTVVVEVTDNGDGTLKAVIDTASDTIAFTNIYKTSGSITLEGTKALAGRDLTAEDIFFFQVRENGTLVATGENDKSGQITFTDIIYGLEDSGIHTYTITEEASEFGGVTDDDSVLTVVVEVTDNGDGTLKAAIITAESDEIAFENIYKAEGGIVLEGTKTLTGREMTKDDSFTFTVTENGAEVSTGANDETGLITFSGIRYDLDDLGTHTYTVTEDDTNIPGVTKDDSAFTVIVTVTDNGDGTLKAEVTGGDTLNFVNPYEAVGSFEPKAIKYIDEIGRLPGPDAVFDFCLTDENGNTVTKQNGTDGIVDFGEIEYTLEDVGTHTYEIREKQLVNGDYVTDAARYIAEVTVSDNGDGTLAVTKTITRVDPDGSETPEDPDEPVVFVNPARISITVHKEWQGGEEPDIDLTLYADGVKVDRTTPVTDPETGETVNRVNYVLTRTGYDYTFSKLIPLNEDGSAIVYSVKEKGIKGYMQIYSNTGAHAKDNKALYDGGTVINRAVTSIRVRKVWSGVSESKRPKITLTLYSNGERTSRKPSGPDKDGWYTFSNLPVNADYYVVEEPVKGMTTTYANNAPYTDVTDRALDGGTITNTGVPLTGDSASPLLWMLLLLAAGCTGIGLTAANRKRRNHQ
ncbi:MAG: FctA domain-containing protein [Clostridia bacterium]|nr:FctA domain-containing protein [Clostridia bacterium]